MEKRFFRMQPTIENTEKIFSTSDWYLYQYQSYWDSLDLSKVEITIIPLKLNSALLL